MPLCKPALGALASLILLASCGGGAERALPEPALAASTVNGTATFTGARSNYTVVATGSGWTVTDKVGSDGVSNLPGTTTTLAFTDFTVNLGIGTKSQAISDSDLKSIAELYVAFFNRVPDADGLSYWIDQYRNGMTIPQICDNFYAAAIYYSSLTGYSASMSNSDFVTVIYKNVLGRTSVDAGGLNYWSTALATGAATRGTLVQAILGSAHSFKGDPTWGWVADLLDNKYAVAKYFAVQEGLNYSSSTLSITNTMAIAAAVTPTDTSAATQLIGVSDTSFSTVPSSAITFYIVDGPVKGLAYACAPSGVNGITDASGSVACRSGDVATLSIPAGSGSINLGQVGVPAVTGIAMPVTLLPDGLQVAEILQALNHGTASDVDVSGTVLPGAAVAQINAYIAGAGALPAGQASDDQFLAGIQAQMPGAALTTPVTGAGTTFRDNSVLPQLQNMIAGIGAINPPPVVVNGATKLTGTIVVSGGGEFDTGCGIATTRFSGGGILNANIGGNIQVPGNYPVSWSSPGFLETVTVTLPPCGLTPGATQVTTTAVPPFGGNGNINVAAGFGGNNLVVPTGQASCTDLVGSDVGAANPLITMAVQCNVGGLVATATVQLVGGW